MFVNYFFVKVTAQKLPSVVCVVQRTSEERGANKTGGVPYRLSQKVFMCGRVLRVLRGWRFVSFYVRFYFARTCRHLIKISVDKFIYFFISLRGKKKDEKGIFTRGPLVNGWFG